MLIHSVKKLFLMIGLLFLSGCFQASDMPNNVGETLMVGTESNFPPFSFKEQGELVGFDIDVINEVARRLGKNIEFSDMNFEALIPQAQLGSIHVIAAGMTPTPERAKIVNFTKPYIQGDPLYVVTLADSQTKDFEDLKNGKRVLVNQGYTADFFMSKVEGIDLIRLETPCEAFLALQQGRADAFVTARNTLAPFYKCCDPEGYERKIIEGTDESTALIVSQKYPDLLVEIQGALDAMFADGTMDQLKNKWGIDV